MERNCYENEYEEVPVVYWIDVLPDINSFDRKCPGDTSICTQIPNKLCNVPRGVSETEWGR